MTKQLKIAQIKIINNVERSNFDIYPDKNKISYSSGITQGYKHFDIELWIDNKCILSTNIDTKIYDIIYPQKQNFIDYFVEEYNKGNVLTEIIIEVETVTEYKYQLLKSI